MSQLNETRQSDFPTEMLFLEHYPLIPVDEQDMCNPETWLYVLKTRESKVTFASIPNTSPITLNSTINLKENSQWLDGSNAGEILLQDIAENPTENDKPSPKIIDTRTFTRPRKNRLSSSPLQQIVKTETAEITSTNLNSTFNFSVRPAAGQNGDLLNATVVIEDVAVKDTTGELNTTFPVDSMPVINGSTEEQLTPNNNNVYNLNNTFSAESGPLLPTKNVPLNATYSEDEPVRQGPPKNILHRQDGSLDEMEELEEDDRLEDEAVFRRPLMPGAVPKKHILARTSTLNNDQPTTDISPPNQYDIERIAKLQEESLAQTSTPMGQRRFSALRRPAVEVEYNLGSPISSLPGPANSTVNYGPPIPISAALSGNANSDSTLDNSNHVARANLTFEKSQNSVEAQSNSPTSPADSPYSSQSLESDSGPSSAHDMIRRSMPNLNNVSRLRMPQPANLTAAGNLNRHHASDSGLRPPGATSSGIRPPVGRFANGPLTMRPQLAVPQTHVSTANPDAVRPSQPQMQKSTMPPPRTSLLPASSRLKQPQLVAPRVTAVSQMQPTRNVAADELNSTVVVEKPVVVHPVAVPLPPPAAAAVPTAAPAPPVFSGIPRPSMSRIPAPRTMLKSSIPTMAFRPRGPH